MSIVLFDLGDVIAAWDPAPRIAEYARRSGLSPSGVRARLSTDGFWTETDRGGFSAAEMEQRICELLGCDFSHEELLGLQAAAFSVRSEILSLAEEVRRGTRVGILTNNAPLLKEAFPHYFPELVGLFDPILFSFQFRHAKPEREIFIAVQAHLALPPGEIGFIDDNPGHVAAAISVGWDAIRFESLAKLRRALAERGLIAAVA